MRQEAPFFEDKEPTLIYIAKKLKEALRLESLLTDAGVDYGVEQGEYRGGFIFMTTRVGAFFYVLPDAAQAARELMQCNRFRPYIDPAPQQESWRRVRPPAIAPAAVPSFPALLSGEM